MKGQCLGQLSLKVDGQEEHGLGWFLALTSGRALKGSIAGKSETNVPVPALLSTDAAD